MSDILPKQPVEDKKNYNAKDTCKIINKNVFYLSIENSQQDLLFNKFF